MSKENKKNSSLHWALIACAVVGTAGLAYFFSTLDNKAGDEVDSTQKNEEKAVDRVETNNEVVVIFEDEILENHIREELSIPEDDIMSTDMLDLYSLSISELGVQSLKGLEYALELNSFSLSTENIKSLDPLKNLSSLERFSLRYSTIEDLPIEFSQDVNFTTVSIVNTKINDVNFLSHMTNIDHLTMTDAGITDISPLKNLNNVIQLNLRGNEISDISVLQGKDTLEILNLQHNNVSDVSPLAGLARVHDLVLSFNPAYDLEPLEMMPSLRTLVVHLDSDVRHLIREQVEILEEMDIDVDYSR